MHLSLKKGAHVALSSAAYRKFGASRSFFARCGIPRSSTGNLVGLSLGEPVTSFLSHKTAPISTGRWKTRPRHVSNRLLPRQRSSPYQQPSPFCHPDRSEPGFPVTQRETKPRMRLSPPGACRLRSQARSPAGSLPSHVVAGQAMKLVIDDGGQHFERTPVATAPGVGEGADVAHCGKLGCAL
jgi:hypothetical protein